MVLSQELFLALFLQLFTWKNEKHDGEYERDELLEGCRECIRSILSITGVHRGTEIFAECWILLTEVKVTEPQDLLHGRKTSSIPISSAAPSQKRGFLRALGQLPHADILEEEISSTLDWVDSMKEVNDQKNVEIDEWLSDLEFALDAAHFALKHRFT